MDPFLLSIASGFSTECYVYPVAKGFDGKPTLYVGGMRYVHEGQQLSIIPVYGSTQRDVIDRMFRIWAIRHEPWDTLVASLPTTKARKAAELQASDKDHGYLAGVPLGWHPKDCACPLHTAVIQ